MSRLAAFLCAAALAAPGAVPAALGGSELVERIQYWRAGSEVQAEVTGVQRLWLRELLSPTRRNVYEVQYRFTTQGGTVTSTGIYRTSRTTSLRPGTRIRVSYVAGDPSSNVVDDVFTAFDAFALAAIGLLVWVAGVFVLWPELNPRRAE